MERSRGLVLAPEVLRLIAAAAREAAPAECCGALAGQRLSSTTTLIESAIPISNPLGRTTRDRYLIGPEAWLRASTDAGAPDRLVGFYHSHPNSAAVPSAVDRDAAWPWYIYLIVSLRMGAPPHFRAWRLSEDRTRFDEQRIGTALPQLTR